MEITYKIVNTDTRTDYILNPNFEEQIIHWVVYPHAPNDMHWKAADQFGLGARHYTDKQTFGEFELSPLKVIDEDKHALASALISKYDHYIIYAAKIYNRFRGKELTFNRTGDHRLASFDIQVDGERLLYLSDLNQKDVERIILFEVELTKLANELDPRPVTTCNCETIETSRSGGSPFEVWNFTKDSTIHYQYANWDVYAVFTCNVCGTSWFISSDFVDRPPYICSARKITPIEIDNLKSWDKAELNQLIEEKGIRTVLGHVLTGTARGIFFGENAPDDNN